ncbi:MAG: adenylate/guanylate cyclase domain-containing protein, partial [Spirochaetia bacterium]|nr:adenylate/guanylate cyclase domain-containing protein [Spirochaetia bacterium]
MIGISNNIESLPVIFDSFIYIAKSFVIFLSGIVSSFVSVQIVLRIQNSYNFLEERNRISDLFGKHVSPIVVDKLLNQKNDFETEVRHVCMMFFDIRNFTSFSENKDPVEVVNYLNCLFDFIIDIINKNNGIVNKFLGDGFMAVFGAPISGEDDVKNAIQSSFEILERIQLEITKGNIPATNVGIGLHAGKAVTGNVGSATRKEYTIIGDVVNLASRIEQLNKKYATQILVSEDVWNLYDKKRG